MTVYRVLSFATLFGQQCVNCIHFQKPDAISSDTALLATKFRDLWVEQFRGRVLNDVTFNRCMVTALDGPSQPSVDLFYVKTGSAGGSVFNTPVTCFVIKLQTGVGGRTGRGRIYWPGGAAGQMTQGKWLNTVLNNWQTLLAAQAANWLGTTPISTFNLVVITRGDPASWKAVESWGVRDVVGVQRRRNIGHGN